jgi:DNA-binding response OmpR family regulator
VFLRDILQFKGYEVQVAHNGLEGLGMAEQLKPALILLDVAMPQLDGYEVCRRLRGNSATAQTPILMLTARGQVAEKVQGLRIGADDYLAKPFAKEELEARIEALLRRFPLRFPLEDTKSICTLSLRLSSGQAIHASLSGADTYECDSTNPLVLSQYDLASYARRVDDARSAGDWRHHVKTVGHDLWLGILGHHPEIMSCYSRASGRVTRERDLRIVYRCSQELMKSPLEFVYQGPDYLVLRHPVSRFQIGIHTVIEPISSRFFNSMMDEERELKILLIASNTDYITGVDEEVAALAQRLHTLVRHSGIERYSINYLPTEQATCERVREELRQCEYHIVHYAGHGYHDEKSPEESCLYLWQKESRQGDVVKIKASELAMLLRDSNLRLICFSCCFGAKIGNTQQLVDDDFLGLADGVIQAGVPSVLGFRWPVSDRGAKLFALSFYESLFSRGDVDVAVFEARCRVAQGNRNDKTWISPVLMVQR